MKKIFATLVILSCIPFLKAQDESNATPTYFGINIGHAIAVKTVSNILSDNTNYLPIHLNLNHSLGNNLGVSSVFIYRLDKDGSYFTTHEFGLAIGPSYLVNNLDGLSIDFKIGYALAFGEDYEGRDYHRSDFVIQPEIAYYIRFQNKLALSFGLGLQTLLKISEEPDRSFYWDWNATGRLSHYYLPVLNISLGFIN